MLAAAIVQDVLTIAAELQAQPIPTLVLVDEFSAVAPGGVVRLFGRGRSAPPQPALRHSMGEDERREPDEPWRGRQPKYEGLVFRRPKRVFLRTPLPAGWPIAVRLSHLPRRSAPPQP
jgi:hypothetical protein